MSPHVSAPITSLQYPFQPWPYCPGRRVARVTCRSDEQQHSCEHRVPRSRIHRTGYLRIIGCSTDIRHAPLTDAPPSIARAQTWSPTQGRTADYVYACTLSSSPSGCPSPESKAKATAPEIEGTRHETSICRGARARQTPTHGSGYAGLCSYWSPVSRGIGGRDEEGARACRWIVVHEVRNLVNGDGCFNNQDGEEGESTLKGRWHWQRGVMWLSDVPIWANINDQNKF
ncbi:hypothetical protein B0H16DRAFT_1455965 [Mycena metata]|uniref:Uncharacterized protein n=1 Tax=Mycena metata TaxID=1033252 RepID=A0AAD7NIS9_9AGAR|nr:hypothetical protein B0H16DRAFT_1455965 [Mycena metata]